MRHTIISLLIAIAATGPVTADVPADSVRIYFRRSHSEADLNFHGNRAAIVPLIRTIRNGAVPHTVTITGAASPEGSTAINSTLSRQRADRIFSILADSVAIPDSITGFTFIGRDWKGLLSLVEADTAVPSRNRVLTLLKTITASIDAGMPDTEANLASLRQIGGGHPYAYMYRTMFPSLRASQLNITYLPMLDLLAPTPARFTSGAPALPSPSIPLLPAKTRKPFYMALKTNMLLDALAIPSISAEFYLGKNWSAVANWMYGWWDNDHRHRYWRAYGGDIAVRRWFGSKAKEKPLTGHHLGLYAGVVTYDFEFGGKGWMGGIPGGTLWDRCNTVAGIEYGYSLPIGRRLNIDFTIGVGYMGGKLVDYVPGNGFYIWQKTRHFNWFGPTKAEISLVWLIGRGNYNAKKGGLK
ncbi:MAG: DUF3575 domain-containing protein [Bacteroides sp.]|nr:DUF3575 domain-containing protein [Bacteroides sp.]